VMLSAFAFSHTAMAAGLEDDMKTLGKNYKAFNQAATPQAATAALDNMRTAATHSKQYKLAPNTTEKVPASTALFDQIIVEIDKAKLLVQAGKLIATAAVADYRVAQVAEHKIKKAGDELAVALVKNPDIVATIAQQEQRPFMVGFAAETQNVEEYAAGKLVAKKLDMIACNDVSRPDIGFASDENAMTVFFAQSYHMKKRELEKASKQEISQQLVESIADALRRRL